MKNWTSLGNFLILFDTFYPIILCFFPHSANKTIIKSINKFWGEKNFKKRGREEKLIYEKIYTPLYLGPDPMDLQQFGILNPDPDTESRSGYRIHIRIQNPDPGTEFRSGYRIQIRVQNPDPDTESRSGYRLQIRIQNPDPHQN